MQPSPHVLAGAALAMVAAAYLCCAGVPYLSESLTHVVDAAAMPGFTRVFDPSLVPFRPVQHGWFYGMQALWQTPAGFDPDAGPSPMLLRLVPFGLHLLCVLMTAVLGRRLGLSPRAAWGAALLFACYPTLNAVGWLAAIGWPVRVLAVQLGIWALLLHLERPGVRTGLLILLAFLVALAANEGSMVFPAQALLLYLALCRGPWHSCLRDPWAWAIALLGLGYAVFMTLLHQREVHQPVPFGAMAANAARASLCHAPELLRLGLLDTLRADGLLRLAGAAGLASLAVGLVWFCWRAPGVVRALLLAMLLDWIPAVMVTGFKPRYGYLSACFLALALGIAAQARTQGKGPHAARPLLLLSTLLGIWWVYDSVQDGLLFRAAGERVRHAVQAGAYARAALGGEQVIVLIDATEHMDRETDRPVLDRGLPEALALKGVPGAFRSVWTEAPAWRRAGTAESAAEVCARLTAAQQAWIRFDQQSGRCVDAWPPKLLRRP